MNDYVIISAVTDLPKEDSTCKILIRSSKVFLFYITEYRTLLSFNSEDILDTKTPLKYSTREYFNRRAINHNCNKEYLVNYLSTMLFESENDDTAKLWFQLAVMNGEV